MCRARRSELWSPFSFLLAAIHNIFAKKPKQPCEFHPMYIDKFVHKSAKFTDSVERRGTRGHNVR